MLHHRLAGGNQRSFGGGVLDSCRAGAYRRSTRNYWSGALSGGYLVSRDAKGRYDLHKTLIGMITRKGN
jgi:hypothetical protein